MILQETVPELVVVRRNMLLANKSLQILVLGQIVMSAHVHSHGERVVVINPVLHLLLLLVWIVLLVRWGQRFSLNFNPCPNFSQAMSK